MTRILMTPITWKKYYKDTSYNTQYVCRLLSPFTTDVPFKHFLSLSISSCFAENKDAHGISSPPYGRSSEKRIDPVPLQLITPSLLKKTEHTLNIFKT